MNIWKSAEWTTEDVTSKMKLLASGGECTQCQESFGSQMYDSQDWIRGVGSQSFVKAEEGEFEVEELPQGSFAKNNLVISLLNLFGKISGCESVSDIQGFCFFRELRKPFWKQMVLGLETILNEDMVEVYAEYTGTPVRSHIEYNLECTMGAWWLALDGGIAVGLLGGGLGGSLVFTHPCNVRWMTAPESKQSLSGTEQNNADNRNSTPSHHRVLKVVLAGMWRYSAISKQILANSVLPR